MTLKIKLIVVGVLLVLAAGATWYVQGLRADNARLEIEVLSLQAVADAQAANLALMQQASRIVAERQAQASATIEEMNAELRAAQQGASHNAATGTATGAVVNKNNDSVGAVVLAAQLNRLFNPSAAGSN